MFLSEQSKWQNYKIIPEWTHSAICYWVVDLWTQETTRWPKKQIVFLFEFPEHKIEIDWVEKPMVLNKRFTASLSDQSKLLPFLQSRISYKKWDWVELSTLVWKPWLVKVDHYINKEWWNSAAINIAIEMPSVMSKDIWKPFNETILVSLEQPVKTEIEKLKKYKYLFSEMEKSPEYQKVLDDEEKF